MQDLHPIAHGHFYAALVVFMGRARYSEISFDDRGRRPVSFMGNKPLSGLEVDPCIRSGHRDTDRCVYIWQGPAEFRDIMEPGVWPGE